jgi:hypothetical protein
MRKFQLFIAHTFSYSVCNLSHLYTQLSAYYQTDFANLSYLPYVQLAARVAGVFSNEIWTLAPCIYNGVQSLNGVTYEDAGYCTGKLSTTLIDASF